MATNAEKLQKQPDDALAKVISETVQIAKQVGTDEYPYAYRYYDTGDEDVMLEVRGVKKRGLYDFELHIVDKSGKRLPIGNPK